MKRVAKVVAGALVLVGLMVAAIFALSESGTEVVSIQTAASDTSTRSTRLWVVDDAGYAWLRAGMGRAAWVNQAEATGEVLMTRDGSTARYRVTVLDDPAVRTRIHALFAGKYGWQDRVIARIRDGDNSLAVRLERVDP